MSVHYARYQGSVDSSLQSAQAFDTPTAAKRQAAADAGVPAKSLRLKHVGTDRQIGWADIHHIVTPGGVVVGYLATKRRRGKRV